MPLKSSGVERRLAAILAADVVGYSRLMGEDEIGTHARLKALRKDFIEPKVAEHRGRIVKLTGDGAMVEFASVVDAVRCGVEVQRSIAEHNAGLEPEHRIEFRVGINFSDVIIDDNDIYGDGVNVAARLEGLAPPGGVCITDVVHQMVRGRLDLAFEDLGEQQVKNIVQPVRTWQWTGDARATGLPTSGVGEATVPPLSDKPSIAVLPFDNLSRDPEQEYFSDVLTEDLITDLSQLSGLSVTARHAVSQYKGRPAPQRVARELGVGYVLEGSVRRVEGRVRINAQLIDAATGFQKWARRFDHKLEDIFALQDEITKAIVAALKVRITKSEEERIARRHPDNSEAYDLYMQGYEVLRHKSRGSIYHAREFFDRAISLAPDLAEAVGRLAHTYYCEWNFGWTDDSAVLKHAIELAEKAVSLNELSPQTHEDLALVYASTRQWAGAIDQAKLAIAVDPNYAKGYARLAESLTFAGSPEEAALLVEKARRLEPHYWDHFYQWVLGSACFAMARDREAISSLERSLRGDPQFFPAHVHLAATYAEVGELERAHRAVVEVLKISPDLSVAAFESRRPFEYKDENVWSRLVNGLRVAGLAE
jgi:adenylate cyclase